MKKIMVCFLASAISLWSYSQENYSMNENKVTQYEMEMTQYPDDDEAEAVVIFEKGDYRFIYSDNVGFLLQMTFHSKIKILSQAGEKYATFEVPLYKADIRTIESFEDLTGITYNLEDGKLIETNFNPRGNVFDEKINENWSSKKFTLPNVKAGSVIEVKYTIKTPFFFNMREWGFQKKIPVVESCLSYRAIPYYEYVFSATNINKFDEQSSSVINQEIRYGNLVYKEMEHLFRLKRIPAFRDEEFITAAKDYMISLNFQLARVYFPTGGKRDYISTWEDLAKDLQKDPSFGKYINSARKEAKKILPQLSLSDKPDKEKISIISDYVKHNFNWTGFYGKYTSKKVSDLLKLKRGNVAEINLFLVGMLEEAGLNVAPIILSTRDHGKINKTYPFMHYFNYVIAQVSIDDSFLFLDATEPMLSDRMVPLRCANTDALIIEKEPKWTFVRQRTISFLQRNLDIVIKDQGKVEVDAQYGTVGQSAYIYRSKYLGNKSDLAKYLKESDDIDVVGEIETTDYEVLNKPFRFNFSFRTKADSNKDKIFINPFLSLFSRNNIFKQSKRTLPVDMNELKSESYAANIHIPEGYQLDFIPENMMLNNDVLQITYNSKISDETIQVEFSYNFKDYVFPAEKYSKLKDSYAQLLSKMSEMIVFSKKEN